MYKSRYCSRCGEPALLNYCDWCYALLKKQREIWLKLRQIAEHPIWKERDELLKELEALEPRKPAKPKDDRLAHFILCVAIIVLGLALILMCAK